MEAVDRDTLDAWTAELVAALGWHLAGRPANVTAPEILAEHAFVWRAFWDLEAARPSNGFGFNPIAWCEIEAWARLHGVALDPHELQAIRAMDRARLEHAATGAGDGAGKTRMMPATAARIRAALRIRKAPR